MEFLNASFLWGLTIVGIPIAIFIWNRSRYTTEDWAAMHLLSMAIAFNRKRMRIEQLLLLLLRIFIFLLLALIFCKPVLTYFRPLLRDTPSSLVFIIDNSCSMKGSGKDGISSFRWAQQIIKTMLSKTFHTSEVIILPTSFSSPSLPTATSPQEAIKKVEELEPISTTPNWPVIFQHTAQLLHRKHLHHEDKQVIILSDFQKSNWSESTQHRLTELIETFSPVTRPRLVLCPRLPSFQRNIGWINATVSNSIVLIDQPIKVYGTLRNFGSQLEINRLVSFYIDGELKSQTRIDLSPGEERQLLFPCKFSTSGSHVLTFSIDDQDDLLEDNRYYFSLLVHQKLPVLLVYEQLNQPASSLDITWLKYALIPYQLGNIQGHDLVTLKSCDPSQLTSKDLQQTHVTILYDITRLTPECCKILEDFIFNGGGLLIFSGQNLHIVSWNQDWYIARNILGWKWSKIDSFLDHPLYVQHPTVPHEALTIFNNLPSNQLETIRIFQRHQIIKDPHVQSLLTLSDGSDMAVQTRYGHGKIIGIFSSLNQRWSNLALKPIFLPLLHQMINYLGSKSYPPRNLFAGESILVLGESTYSGREIKITQPDGKIVKISLQANNTQSSASYSETYITGIYSVETTDGELIHYVVNTPKEESLPIFLGEEELRLLARKTGGTIVSSPEEFINMERQRRYGQEIWELLVWIMTFALFGELVLIQYYQARQVKELLS